MTAPIIKPPHAISLWVDGGVLHVELPGTDADKKAHVLRLPLNVFGMTHIVNLLQARTASSRIGEKGDPTQFQSNKALAALAKGFDPDKIKRPKPKVTWSAELRAGAREALRKVGLS